MKVVRAAGTEMLAQQIRGGGVTMPSHGDAGTEGCQALEGFVIKSGTEAEGVRGCSN